MTTQDKLTRLIDTKIAIRQAIMNLGVDVPYDTPFSGYPELISKIVGDFEETTTDQDLLQMVDAYNFLGIDGYEDHTYTDEELQKINELIDIIINGPEEVEPELEPTVLLITDIGETRYHEGETFSLDGYTITAVYGDGRRVDVTADCSFTPSVELVTEDEYVMISCEIDGTILTVKQAINVTVAPTFVDYIQSSGTQYINTEFIPSQDTKIVADIQMIQTTYSDGWQPLFGSRMSSSATDRFVVWRAGDDNNLASMYGSYPTTLEGIPISGTLLDRNVITLDKNNLYYNDVLLDTGDLSVFRGACSIYLFSINTGGTADSRKPIMRVFSFKIYDNGVLVKDFKPCQDGEGTYCLYDTVRKKYHYNQGTGTFVGGKLLEPEQLDYIQVTGTQYINTGVIPTANTTYEISVDIDTPTTQTDTCLFGSRPTGGSDQFILWDGHNNTSVTRKSIFVAGTLGEGVTVQPNVTQTVFKYDNGNTYVNGELTGALSNKVTSANNYPLYLFALNQANTADSRMYKGKFYYFKIFENGVLIRNFIPYKDEFGTNCVKDLVENKYYYNKGKGNFLAPIPENLTVVNYIQSSGTQYIDTGFYHNQNTRIVMDYDLLEYRDWASLVGSMGDVSGAGKLFFVGCYNNGSYYAHYGTQSTNFTITATGRHTIDFNKNSLKIDSTTKTMTANSFQAVYTSLIFGATNYDGTKNGSVKMKLYAYKLYDNDGVVHNMVPVKDENNVYFLYDTAQSKCYYNQGTGEFLGE